MNDNCKYALLRRNAQKTPCVPDVSPYYMSYAHLAAQAIHYSSDHDGAAFYIISERAGKAYGQTQMRASSLHSF